MEEIAGGKGGAKLGFWVRVGERKNEGESEPRVGENLSAYPTDFRSDKPDINFLFHGPPSLFAS